MLEYVDVRGPWPVYIRGFVAVVLEGCIEQSISLEVARAVAEARLKG